MNVLASQAWDRVLKDGCGGVVVGLDPVGDRVGDMVGQAERCETAAQRFGDKKGYQMAEEFLTK